MEDPFKTSPPKDEEAIEAHAPYFPTKKNELWWLLLGDERTGRINGITRISSLKHKTEVKIQFQAPLKTGTYTYSVFLLSDSYVGFDITKPLKLVVTKDIAKPKEQEIREEEDEEEPEEEETNNHSHSEEDD